MNEKKNIELEKRLKSLVPIDNDAFSYFAKNKKFCEEFLRVILEDDNLSVLDNEPQKKISNVYFKEAVLDMICKLSDGKIVNVEIQLYKDEDSARRIFQYASMIRHAFVEKGTKYKDIKDVIIIYLTKDDIFHKGNTTYKVDMKVISDTNECIKDFDCGLKILYVNTKGATKEKINEYLKILSDQITYNDKYIVTTKMKKDLFEIVGGNVMFRNPELEKLFNEVKEEIRIESTQQERERLLNSLVSKGVITREEANKELQSIDK